MKHSLVAILLAICLLLPVLAFAETEMPQGSLIVELGEFDFSKMEKKPDKVGLMNDDGKTVIKPQFDAMENLGGGWYTTEKNGKVGLANTLGKIVQKPVFDSIVRNEDGTFTTSKGGSEGLLSTAGKEIIKPGAMVFSRLENGIYLIEQKGKAGLLTAEGKTLLKPTYESIQIIGEKYYACMAGGKAGILTDTGKVLVKPAYDEVSYIESLGLFAGISGEKSTYIGIDGKPTSLVGKEITLGNYEQDNVAENGPEPIEWIIIDSEGTKLFLLSKYVLDCKSYDDKLSEGTWGSAVDVTWETCVLRTWLNSEFVQTAFNSEELSQILVTEVNTPDNSIWETLGGNNTLDRVFVLSVEECLSCCKLSSVRESPGTPYCFAQGSHRYSPPKFNETSWWLRTPAETQDSVLFASYDRDCDHFMPEPIEGRWADRPLLRPYYEGIGNSPISDDVGVRPAMWIDIG